MAPIAEFLITALSALTGYYDVCGVIDRESRIYPLGSDTKVLSTIFELITRPVVYKYAAEYGLEVVEPPAQNHYPDFTLHREIRDHRKIAVDVKTTYRWKATDSFDYTLGGYTSFIREGKGSKNIVYPFNQYSEHWVIGFVYDRAPVSKSAAAHVFTYADLSKIPLPFSNVEFFVQEKWRIASDRAGSGNTTNIGSLVGRIEDFRQGRGCFESEDEFLEYWRGYERTKGERLNTYSNIHQFRRMKSGK